VPESRAKQVRAAGRRETRKFAEAGLAAIRDRACSSAQSSAARPLMEINRIAPDGENNQRTGQMRQPIAMRALGWAGARSSVEDPPSDANAACFGLVERKRHPAQTRVPPAFDPRTVASCGRAARGCWSRRRGAVSLVRFGPPSTQTRSVRATEWVLVPAELAPPPSCCSCVMPFDLAVLRELVQAG
jgi:hypothetical protein